jgi:hypothetical protein
LTKNRSGGKRLIASFTKILFAYHPSPEIAERRFRKSFQNPKVRIENKSFALTGPVVAVKVEADGDLHVALQDATGDKQGIVVWEIPAKPQWCELRKIVFGWTQVQFLFRVRSGRKLKLSQPPIVTVIGKAFFDIGHAPADHGNRRTDLQGYAAWEIHPMMNLNVQ